MLKSQKTPANAALLRMVSPLYAGRRGLLTAALQYVYQAVRIGEEDAAAGRVFSELAACKFLDLEEMGSFLIALGADPVFTACPPYPVSYHSCAGVDYAKDLPAMLAADIRLETAIEEELEKVASFTEDGRLLRWKERAAENLSRLRAFAPISDRP